MSAPATPTLQDELAREGVLLVLRGPHRAGPIREEPARASPQPEAEGLELFLAVDQDGGVTAYNGHVDLGTGIRTALAQIVAEEIDVALGRVAMVLGDTGRVPSQGATIASETIQVTAVPLRQAAAQARPPPAEAGRSRARGRTTSWSTTARCAAATAATRPSLMATSCGVATSG